MPLTQGDIAYFASVLNSDTVPAQNGGRKSNNQVVSGVKNNLFLDATAAQRLSGITQRRKAFIHIISDTTTALNNVRVFLDRLTNHDDYLLIQTATATGTEATDADDTALYGVGMLTGNVSAGVEAIAVTCEHADYAALLPYRVGMLVRISDIAPGTDVGKTEFVRLTAVSIIGAAATLTFTGSPLANAFLAANTIVSGVIEQSAVAGAFNTPVVTSAAGTLAHATAGNLTVPGKGSIDDSWTLTFSSATAFSVSGTVTGALSGTGTIGADFSAINPSTSTALFKILSTAWGGTFVAGDTVTFNTTPASLPLFLRRRIPANSGTLANDVGAFAYTGESA